MRLRQPTRSPAPRLSPTASTSSYDAAADLALALRAKADSLSTPWWSHFLQYSVAASLHTAPAGITLADSHSPQTFQPPSPRGTALNLVQQPALNLVRRPRLNLVKQPLLNLVKRPSLDSSPHQPPFFGSPAPSPPPSRVMLPPAPTSSSSFQPSVQTCEPDQFYKEEKTSSMRRRRRKVQKRRQCHGR